MIKGIGMDLVELSRIEEVLERQPRFIERILTEQEQYALSKLNGKRRIEFFAGRFAAKEAFAKAFGTGIGEKLSFLDIEVKVDELGKPIIIQPFSEGVHLSITHTESYAAAQVVIENKD